MTSPDLSAFAKFMPGLEFMQHFTRSAAKGSGAAAQPVLPGMPALSHWVAPTLDVEEIDKRIQDLRTVHFWLDQNTKVLAATIQALEVQKLTLVTLKSMNVSMQDMAETFRMRPQQTEAVPPSPGAAAAPAPQTAAADPMQWWAALTQQFQAIASDTMRDMADHAAKTTEQVAQNVQTSVDAAAERAQQSASTRPPRPGGKKSAPDSGGPAPAPMPGPQGKIKRTPRERAAPAPMPGPQTKPG